MCRIQFCILKLILDSYFEYTKSKTTLTTGHDSFSLHPFKFTVHKSDCHLTLCKLAENASVINRKSTNQSTAANNEQYQLIQEHG